MDLDEKEKVHREVSVADSRITIHPEGYVAQMESGIIYGLSGAISIENSAVAQSNFHDYPVTRMKDAPKIETYILTTANSSGGAGEPSTPLISPAATDANFNATRIQMRKLPISKQDLRGSLQKSP